MPSQNADARRDKDNLPRVLLRQDDRVDAYAEITVGVLIAVLEDDLPANGPALRRVARETRACRRFFLAAERHYRCWTEREKERLF